MRFELIKEQPTEKTNPISNESIEPMVAPTKKAKEFASNLKLFGWEPTPEQVEPLRHALALGTKEFAGSAAGATGDILSFLKNLMGIKGGNQYLPTSENIKGLIEKGYGEPIQAETSGEEYTSAGLSGLGSLMGFGGPIKGATALKTAIRTVAGGMLPSIAGKAAERANLPDWAQAATAVGTAFLTHKMTGKSLRDIEKGLYNKANDLAGNAIIKSDNLVNRLEKLQSKMSEGITTGPKARIHSAIEEIKGKAGGGGVKVTDLMQYRRDVNEISKEFTRDQFKGSEMYWKGLRTSIDQSIGDFEKNNKAFSSVYRQANSLHRGINESRTIERFLKRHPLLAGEAGALGWILKATTESTIGLKAIPVLKTAEVATALYRNPGLRKAYFNVLKSASKEEVRSTLKYLKQFNELADEEGLTIDEKKSRFEIIKD